MSDGASFQRSLSLMANDEQDLVNAATAIREEYRGTTRWKRLKCRSISLLDDNADRAIYVLSVGGSVDFDWTWEGAFALRIKDMEEVEQSELDLILADSQVAPVEDGLVTWHGEVVEVNSAGGEIYVSVYDSEKPPCIGSFFVRPFEFLETLHAIYREERFSDYQERLPSRLAACRGNQHPLVSPPPNSSLSHLDNLWRHGWGILWGPPGTGKTYTIGQQVAKSLSDPTERILVVSTTNKATDGVALSIGRAAGNFEIAKKKILRIGKNADYNSFRSKQLEAMLAGCEAELLYQMVGLRSRLKMSQDHGERAKIRQQLQHLREAIKDRALEIFLSKDARVVVATAFRALTLLKEPGVSDLIKEDQTPFTTVIIDEAGLLSRATTAALSLLAARRVVLVGDPKQLAPISKMSRVLPTVQATWLARSSLSHLTDTDNLHAAIYLLIKQYRMHPDICRVVSEYQYDGKLEDADKPAEIIHREKVPWYRRLLPLDPPKNATREESPRAVWYVLDEDNKDSPNIRAERGPGNRSWIRPITPSILDKLLSHPVLHDQEVLFISPFAAQAKAINAFLAERNLEKWSASTVHSQQGAEADVVIFDTVNASSTAWPSDEWKRLINVGISRARHFLIVIASQAEMRQSFLLPLASLLFPVYGVRVRQETRFQPVTLNSESQVPQALLGNPQLLGNQIIARKQLRPILSFEQQRLSGYRMDGKPRLVRGVAGSGKTMVLANWLTQVVRTLRPSGEDLIWVVYANDSLKGLIESTAQEAWNNNGEKRSFPYDRVEVCHIGEVLRQLLDQLRRNKRLTYNGDFFDYDAKAAFYLQNVPADQIQHRCLAMFIDEAQDMGPNTLRLLALLVKQTDSNEPNSRAINIFYDNAQNIYGRSTPKWTDLGLDMRGRSTVMKESFRSTKPITEYALNLLYRLNPPVGDDDHRELVERHLIEQTHRNGQEWWNVRFAQTEGPLPTLRKYQHLPAQLDAIAEQIVQWVQREGVRPGDICLLYNGKESGDGIQGRLCNALKQRGIPLELRKGKDFAQNPNVVLASTSHSFKGYDAEIVVIVGADAFVGGGKILANVLYTAMTRARSILAIYTNGNAQRAESQTINRALEECLDTLMAVSGVEEAVSPVDDLYDLLEILGADQRNWLEDLWKKHPIQQEPLLAEDGQILAEPLFWFANGSRKYACFGKQTVGPRTRFQLEDRQIVILNPGDPTY